MLEIISPTADGILVSKLLLNFDISGNDSGCDKCTSLTELKIDSEHLTVTFTGVDVVVICSQKQIK